MSGCRSGVAKLINDTDSIIIISTVTDTFQIWLWVRGIKALQGVMDITHEISGLIKLSPKRDNTVFRKNWHQLPLVFEYYVPHAALLELTV